jgi:hypothetical protein
MHALTFGDMYIRVESTEDILVGIHILMANNKQKIHKSHAILVEKRVIYHKCK